MNLDKKQKELLEFVKFCHGNQTRKYTGELYWTHPYAVAKKLYNANDIQVDIYPYIEVAFCHDLFEDTGCTDALLLEHLKKLGYHGGVAKQIVMLVKELTDEFTTEAYPELGRERRKFLEWRRSQGMNSMAQTIKYVDLIHNTETIVKYDKKFAKIYLQEKADLLRVLKLGDYYLYLECCYYLVKGMKEVGIWQNQK